ncbi:hypothetical protein WJX79_001230 [Trebouxia sp. C0005]
MVIHKAVKRNNVVFFEHLFLGVGDMNTAHIFYEEGLGLVYDPSVRSGQKKGVGVSWLNIGDQQVHIDQEESISRTPGPVRLLLPDLNDLQNQMQQILGGSTSALQRTPATAQAITKDLLKVCCCHVMSVQQKPLPNSTDKCLRQRQQNIQMQMVRYMYM